MGSYTKDSFKAGAFASFDIETKKEDKLYRTLLHYSMKDFLESYNYFLENNLPNILRGKYTTNKGNLIHVKDIEVTYPQFQTDEGLFWNTPFIAGQTGSSYMSDIRIIYTETKRIDQQNMITGKEQNMAGITSEIKTRKIGSMHILVGSNRCVTTFKPTEYSSLDEWKITLSECPASIGCYTINNGQQKTVTCDQKLKTNIFMTFLTNDDYPRIETRITNMYHSMTAVVRMQIGKNLPNVKVLLPFLKGSHIPLYLIFYLLYYDFSMKTTERIEFSTTKFGPLIASFAPLDERDRIIAYLTSSRKKFESFFISLRADNTYHPDLDKIRSYIQAKMKKPRGYNSEANSELYTEKFIAEITTNELFVQCKSYNEKLGNLCYMTCQTIRCAIGTRSLDSRDDLANQKVDSFIRMQATYCTDQLLNAIRNETEDKGFQYGKNDRKEVIVEARKCITLNETIGEMCKIANRVNVRTSSVTLRQVSEDQLPFICPVKTPESSLTGLIKQKAAATHISDNREYEINHYLPVEDLFNPYIKYISDKMTPEFKYRFIIVTGNNQSFPLFYAKPGGGQPDMNSIFVSSRILNLFNKLLEQKQVMYYIDDDSIIYMKFLPHYTVTKYSFQTFLGGTLYADVPASFVQEFAVIINSHQNPDYRICSSVQPMPGCEMTLTFKWKGDLNTGRTVTMTHGTGQHSYLQVSDFFIELVQRSKILGKQDKLYALSEEDKIDSNGNKIIGKKMWIIETKEPLHLFSHTHWSGVKCEYMIPAHMALIFKVLINVVNEYISYEKSKTYSASLSFNGTTILDPNPTGFYARPVWVDGKKTEEYFRRKRRQGVLPYDSFAHYDEKDNSISYNDDPGRLMSPLLIVDDNGDLIIDKINGWSRFNGYDYENSKPLITSLYKEGCIEMLDAKEMDSTLVAIDLEECRGFNKLRKFLNIVDLKQLNSSLYKIKGSKYYKNEDFTSVRINGNHHDVEWLPSNVSGNNVPAISDVDVQNFTQDGVTYYGNYVIKKKVAKKLTTKVQKMEKHPNSTIMDTYHLIYRDTNSHEYFKKGDFKFITNDMDPEFDGSHIYIFNNTTQRIDKFEVFQLDFGKKAGKTDGITECFVDENCSIVSVETFTRPSLEKNIYYVVDGKIIDDSQLFDQYFYIKYNTSISKDINGNNIIIPVIDKVTGKQEIKYVIPTEYIFPDGEYTTVFDNKQVKIYRPLLKSFTDLIRFNPETHANPEGDYYDPREARLYNATIRRYVESLNQIPDSILGVFSKPDEFDKVGGKLIGPATQISLDEQFHILSMLKKNINEFGVKRQIAIIRKFLNTEFKFTHVMCDPNQAYSFVTNFVPRINANPGPRATYQSAMGVQALGVGNTVHYRKFETSVKRLISPTEHPFETVSELPCNQVAMPITQNFVYLVAANYKGFEDPIILSKAALEKYGRYEKEICVKLIETKNNNFTETLAYPCNNNGDPRTGHIFRHLDKEGLPRLGSRIVVGDCVVGRNKVYTSINATGGYSGKGGSEIKRVDSSQYAGVGTEGIVTAIHIVGSENINSGFRTIIIKLAQRRKQQAGDKMTARYSQKGTIGDIIGGMINDGDPRLKIVDDCLMPYVAAGPNKGMRAEIVFNPASFPSRMTCGLIDEVLCSKASLYLQKKVDATSFHNLNQEYYRDALWENPIFNGIKKHDSSKNNLHLDINASEILCHSDGEIIMDTSTGKPRQFYMGIVAYQFLKHHVADKETARFRGTVKPITGQPDEGRHIGGGQRIGEMERDAIISSGASGILLDRFMKCSDGYVGIYCFRCRNDSSVSDLKSNTCNICGTIGTLCAVDEPRIYKVFKHQMVGIGMNILQTLKPVDDFDAEKLRGNRMDGVQIGMNNLYQE